MDRGSSLAFQNEVIKPENMPVHLVSVHLDSETLYMNDSYKTINYDGNDYLGVGYFLGFSDIEEASEVVVSSMTLSLSGIDKTMIILIMNNDYINRIIKVWTAFLDVDSHALIIDPVLIFEGHIDSPTISEDPDGGKSTISVSATNAWADFDRKTGRHGNNEEQQVFFPGDRGFEFADQNTANIIWGKKNK
jgi:hypothetical protein